MRWENNLQREQPSLGFPILANVAREWKEVRVSCHVRGADSSHGCTLIAWAAEEVEDGNKAEEGEHKCEDEQLPPVEVRECEPDTKEEGGSADSDVNRSSSWVGWCQGVISRAASGAID